jgi:phosphate-selective porin
MGTFARSTTAGLLAVTLAASTAMAQQPPAAPPPAPTAKPAAPSSGVKFSGYLQARETWQAHAGLTGSLNRARLTATGGIATAFTWRIQGEFRTGNVGNGKASVGLTDAYIRWKRNDLGIEAGQFKTPFTREYVTSLADLETCDRSTVVDSLAPKRDIGLMADYEARKKATVYIGLFNGEGVNTTSNKDSTILGVVRLVVRPIPEISIGANLARYFGDSTRYGADVNYEGPRLTVRAEYVAQARDSIGGKQDRGWFALAGVRVVDALQLVGKYEDFRRDQVSLQQRNAAWTAGANLFLAGSAVKLTVEYVSRKVGDPGRRKGLLLSQLQVRY